MLGAAMLAFKAYAIRIPLDVSIVHAHMAFVGWLVNLVIGVALWFLPVNRERFADNRGRYPALKVRITFVLLNAGLLLRIVAEPLFDARGASPLLAMLLVLSGIMQLAAIVSFVSIVWYRVRQA